MYEHVSDRLAAEVEGTAALIEQLPELDSMPEPWSRDPLAPAFNPGRPSSEADYRALESLLTEADPQRVWGGLSRVTTPEGLTLYLCPEHAAAHRQRS